MVKETDVISHHFTCYCYRAPCFLDENSFVPDVSTSVATVLSLDPVAEKQTFNYNFLIFSFVFLLLLISIFIFLFLLAHHFVLILLNVPNINYWDGK